MFRFPSSRIWRPFQWWGGSVQASQCSSVSMTVENRCTASAVGNATGIFRVDDDTESATGPRRHQTVEFSSSAMQVVPLALTNDVARSALSFYLEVVYRIGMCPHAEHQLAYKGRWGKFQKVCYLCVVVFSIFHIFRTIKFDAMEFLGKDGHIGRMMGATFVAIYGFNTISLMYFLAFKWDAMMESLHSLKLTDSMYLGRTRQQVNQGNKMIGQAVLALTLALVIVLLISGFYRKGAWSLQAFLAFESYYTRSTFTIWGPKQWENGTGEIWVDYWDDASPISISLGVLGGISSFCGWIQEHLVLDVMLLLNFAMREHMSRLIAIIHDEHASLDTKWEEYAKVRKLSEQVNVAFQYLLPLAHVSNLFLVSYFLLLGGFLKIRLVYIILLGAKVGKILVTYFVASATAFKNKIIQSWVRNFCEEEEQVTIKGKRKQAPVLLSIAYNDLIGLGYDDFFINQKFLIMFIGTVGTVFLLLVDWHKNEHDLYD